MLGCLSLIFCITYVTKCCVDVGAHLLSDMSQYKKWFVIDRQTDHHE